MFARIKKSGKYKYLQIVENRKENGKVKQRVIATLGRKDQLHPKGTVLHRLLSTITADHSAVRYGPATQLMLQPLFPLSTKYASVLVSAVSALSRIAE